MGFTKMTEIKNSEKFEKAKIFAGGKNDRHI